MKGRVWQEPRSKQWVVILNLGYHPNGKRNCPWVGRYATKGEAEDHLVRALHDMQEGSYVDVSSITVAEWAERWLRDYVTVRVRDTTLAHYSQALQNHIIPDLGSVRLQKLDKPTVQASVTRWGQEYKASTVRQIAAILKAMLKEAVESGLIKRNPSLGISLPKMGSTDRRALSARETRDLLTGLAGTRLYLPTLLSVSTGMRRGEILGLKWSAIEGNMARVTESIVENGAVHAPKSAQGTRSITLPATVVSALVERKRAQIADRLAAGRGWHDTGYVFTRADGNPWSASELSNAFARKMKALGVDLCFHELRHTHGSQMLEAGYAVNLVAERLGHDPSETLRTYAHVIAGADARVAETVDEMFANGGQ